MSENKQNNPAAEEQQEQLSLDDGRRVKVLSPGMMVFKRFMRNRLAITGLIILAAMFIFSFVGGIISPYSQSQVFYKHELISKEYAGATVNTAFNYVVREGHSFSASARANFNLAVKGTAVTFEDGDMSYSVLKDGTDFYRIGISQTLANISVLGKITDVKAAPGVVLADGVSDAVKEAIAAGSSTFDLDGVTYTVDKKNAKSYILSSSEDVVLATKLAFDAFDSAETKLVSSFDFRLLAEHALHNGIPTFELDGVTYNVIADSSEDTSALITAGDREVASVSNMTVKPIDNTVFLPVAFKAAAAEAIADRRTSFDVVNDNGETETYTIEIRVNSYIISGMKDSLLIDQYTQPNKDHWLGNDDHGMDVLTRLMYGGRISLMVGFVVVILEMIIGIFFGGISGYFGGWVDTLMMRFVDLFNSIPYYPMMIIAGAVMDSLEVNPYNRIFLLMGIMGLMGWTGVARVVRGQILSLREQDFMVATECTGIRVSRRIFKHLVPNVMPLLIVQATMGLGGIILTEATLSYLGLGIKYPLASWGTIINSASNVYVMQNFPFIWIPAGCLIVLTVLGFNFVGDGLRDAFDPKMKR